MSDVNADLQEVVHANDKLLKALTILLTLKDEHLLGELRTIFKEVICESREPGHETPAVWRRLREDLALITSLVNSADESLDGHDSAR